MKKILVSLLIFNFVLFASAQTQNTVVEPDSVSVEKTTVVPFSNKIPSLGKSPMDMAYFPADYPVLKTQKKTTTPPVARVIYSRPQKNERNVFGELIAYNEVWRLGANEATEIEFFKDVIIAGKKIMAGRYTMYAIPKESEWTLIINKDTDSWGAFVYDQKKDVVRTDVPVQKLATPVEPFSMSFIKWDKGTQLFIAWADVSVTLPIEIK